MNGINCLCMDLRVVCISALDKVFPEVTGSGIKVLQW